LKNHNYFPHSEVLTKAFVNLHLIYLFAIDIKMDLTYIKIITDKLELNNVYERNKIDIAQYAILAHLYNYIKN